MGVKNNPFNSPTVKLGEHIPSLFWISTILLFKSMENKQNVQRSKNCRKFESL